MKGKSKFLVRAFHMMIAVMVLFVVGTADKVLAATGSVVVSVAEFTSDGSSAGDDYLKSFSGGYLEGGVNDPCLVAPVKIPGNATKINRVIVYLTDDGSGTVSPYFQLTSINIATAFAEDYVSTDVTTGDISIQAIDLPLIKQKTVKGRVYQLGTCLDAGQLLYGAKVIYTVP